MRGRPLADAAGAIQSEPCERSCGGCEPCERSHTIDGGALTYRTFTLRWIPEASFDTEAFDRFVADHDVLAVTQHFFIQDSAPWWSLRVSHRPRELRA